MGTELWRGLENFGVYKFTPEEEEAFYYAESHFTSEELTLLRRGDALFAFFDREIESQPETKSEDENLNWLNEQVENEFPGYFTLHSRFNAYVTEWWHESFPL